MGLCCGFHFNLVQRGSETLFLYFLVISVELKLNVCQ